MLVTLTDEEFEKIKQVAIDRHDAKDPSFRNSRIMSDKTFGVYFPHITGALGEYAWSKLSGQQMDLNLYAIRDGGYDFEGIEVKTITYTGKLEPELKIMVKEWQLKKPHTYVLMHYDMHRSIKLLGTISREDFDKNKVKKKYGQFKHFPDNYVVPLSKMERYDD